jgi:hypothetical protein
MYRWDVSLTQCSVRRCRTRQHQVLSKSYLADRWMCESSLSHCLAKHIMPILLILYYNGSLVT